MFTPFLYPAGVRDVPDVPPVFRPPPFYAVGNMIGETLVPSRTPTFSWSFGTLPITFYPLALCQMIDLISLLLTSSPLDVLGLELRVRPSVSRPRQGDLYPDDPSTQLY